MTNDMNEERAVTVLTCRGDVSDPSFPRKLQKLVCKLHRLVNRGKRKDEFQVTKVEPWNSVRVTFNIPREAAERLQRLAESGDRSLREMGILSVQVDGDQIITLTLSNSITSLDLNLTSNNNNNQAIELGVTTTSSTSAPPLRCNTDPSPSSSSSISPKYHHSDINRVSSDSSSPTTPRLTRDVCKITGSSHNNNQQQQQHSTSAIVATTATSSSRSVSSVSSSVSPSRGLSTPPTPPDSVSLESRPESASLEESSLNDPLKSQLLSSSSSSSSSSFSVKLNIKSTNSSNVNVQQPLDHQLNRIIKDPNDLSSQVTIDVSEPTCSLSQNEPFRSPNVLVTDPLHILGVSTSSSSPSTLLSPSVHSSAMIMSAIIPTGKRRSSSQSSPGQMVSVPFPFASMQHAAMHSKQGNLNHPRPVQVFSPGKSPHDVVDRGVRSGIDTALVPSSRVTLSCSPISSTSNRGPEVSPAKSASSNVALTSPLLVNLLQTESSQESKSSLNSTKITNNRNAEQQQQQNSSSSSSSSSCNQNRKSSNPSFPPPSSSPSPSSTTTTSVSSSDDLRGSLSLFSLPKPDLTPANDIQRGIVVPVTVAPPFPMEPSVSSQVTVTCNESRNLLTPFHSSNNNSAVNNSRQVDQSEKSLLTDSSNEVENRNGSLHHHDDDEAMDQQELNNHDCSPRDPVVNDIDRGKREDVMITDTRTESMSTNCHRSGFTSPEQSNHLNSLAVVTNNSHTTVNNNNNNNNSNSSSGPLYNNSNENQATVNGKHDEDGSDDEGEGVINDEEILDEEDLDELSDLPPLEPADMAMEMDDDCSSNEMCNTSTTPTFTCVFADQEAVSLSSLDGRQVYSVASGDHNYICVKTENQSDCRSNSAHDNLVDEPSTHSDLDPSIRPNYKCSDGGVGMNSDELAGEPSFHDLSSSSSSLNVVVLSSSHHLQQQPQQTCNSDHYHSSELTSLNKESVINNCHPKKEDSVNDSSSQPRNKTTNHDSKSNKISSSGSSSSSNVKLLTDNSDQSHLTTSGQERRVNSSKMKITSESLSADLFLVNSVPIQSDPQTSSVDESSFFQSEANNTTSSVSLLKKKKSKASVSGGGVSQSQTATVDPGSGIKRRRVVKEGGGVGSTNNRL